MQVGEANIKSLLYLMTDEAVNEFAGVLIQQHGLFSIMAKLSAEVGEQLDPNFEQRNELSLAKLADDEKLFEKHSFGEDGPEAAKLAVQKIIQRAVNQAFGENHQSVPANRTDFQTAAGVLKSPRRFLADALDGGIGLSLSDPPVVVRPTPTWDVQRDGNQALAIDTSSGGDPNTKLQLIKTEHGWKIDSLLGGDNFAKATTVESVDSTIGMKANKGNSEPSPASEKHPLLNSLHGDWHAHFVDDATGDDNAKLQVIDDLLLWTDADGEVQEFLLSITGPDNG